MEKKDRWLSAIGLVISILPLIMILVMMKFLPDEISYSDIFTGKVITFHKKSYLWIGLFCIVPLSVIIIARIFHAKGLMQRNFKVVIICAIVVALVYSFSVFKMVYDQVKNISIIENYDYIGTVCSTVCIAIALFSNVLPYLKPNMIFGIKNKKTLANSDVWKKVNTIAGNVMLYMFLISSILAVSAQGVFAVAILGITILAYYIWAYIYSGKVYDLIVNKGEKDGSSQKQE